MVDIFSLSLDKIDIGIIIIDDNCNIVFWNKYIEKISKRSATMSLHKNIKDVIGIFQSSFYQSALKTVIINNQSRFFSSKLHKAFILPENSDYNEVHQNMKIEPININNSVYALIQVDDISHVVSREHKLTSLLSELKKGYEEIQESEKMNKILAETDSLTGLTNRYYITERLNELISKQEDLINFSLFFIDLDGFKNINDTFGHDIGDLVLKKTAEKLKKCIGSEDSVSRLGGDEFVLLLKNVNQKSLNSFAEKIRLEIAKPFDADGLTIQITASMGILKLVKELTTSSEILKKADAAMYQAKKQGKNQYVFYNDMNL